MEINNIYDKNVSISLILPYSKPLIKKMIFLDIMRSNFHKVQISINLTFIHNVDVLRILRDLHIAILKMKRFRGHLEST